MNVLATEPMITISTSSPKSAAATYTTTFHPEPPIR
jgi:hypothetical protein